LDHGKLLATPQKLELSVGNISNIAVLGRANGIPGLITDAIAFRVKMRSVVITIMLVRSRDGGVEEPTGVFVGMKRINAEDQLTAFPVFSLSLSIDLLMELFLIASLGIQRTTT
jgi:hypothetical protein